MIYLLACLNYHYILYKLNHFFYFIISFRFIFQLSRIMNCPDLKYTVAYEVYQKLILVAQNLNVLSPYNAADKTIEFIHSQLEPSAILSENVDLLRKLLLNSQSSNWGDEEKLILLAHFLLTFSMKTSTLRFLQFSTKSYDEVLMKLNDLATLYRILLPKFSFSTLIRITNIVNY